ncbi:MAG: hypothetical protein JWN22_3182 [Nocardioides sp.]|nr:hypothetical protein [Nocardioides sp.]
MTVPLREAVRRRVPPDLLSFLAVGGAGYVVDVAAFNVLRSVAPFATADPTIARCLAVMAAMVVTYLGNRTLTWGARDADPPETFGRVSARHREIALFVLFNIIGLGFSVVCLLVSHDLLGLTSRWSDNISANVVGLALGTVFRYLTYRHVVFAQPQPRPQLQPESEPGPGGGTRVVIVSASMAAGHDGAAAELARRATALGCRVHRVDLLDLLPLGTGWLLRTSYRLQLRVAPRTWGWLLPLVGRADPARSWSARVPSWLVRSRLLLALEPVPGMVVSTYPLASQALSDLRSRGLLACPAVTFLTDMSVHPLWVAPGIDGHLALHDVPAAEAADLGARDVQVVGPAVDPAFVRVTENSRREARRAWALPEDAPLALVVAGSWGVGDVAATVDDLLAAGVATPVVVCGTNAALHRAVAARPGAVAFGWVDDMPSLMRACDLVIQNSGGLTSLEARQVGLPVITYRCLPGHGHTNARALERAGWAPWARDLEDLGVLVSAALATCPPGDGGDGVVDPALTGVGA